MRILCEYKKWFGKIKNPCRRVLTEIDGKVIKTQEGEIEIEGAKQITLKCPGCGNKTTINLIDGGK